MLSSLLRPKKSRRRVEHSPFSSHYADQTNPSADGYHRPKARHATADFTETELDDEDTEEAEQEDDDDDNDEDEDQDQEEGDGDEDGDIDTPLLPIFSAAHLDALPVYNLTHAIRLIVLPRTETTLTWDQLRSPQVSQFLVKPMQQQIRTSHFSRATLYALMANCLQFQKEGQANPGNAGNSRTRAMVCELLAIKLLKEYNTRELIDALSYDFFPLQGIAAPSPSTSGNQQKTIPRPAAARISTLEVAIRASAKRFLAHPVVVQQLEAIWAGTIVFHSAADNLHRPQAQRNYLQQPQRGDRQHLVTPGPNVGYGTSSLLQTSPDKQPQQQMVMTRRTVTLYDPRDASLFKLSRLRVPRYRQFFSTCSLAILLVLFVAVLAQRSVEITALEIVFWFWSAGFMLDEVVGFNEQGFSLYLMSFWNTFDLGILLLLIVYYAMRIYSIFLADFGRREWNDMAYDVLASTAVLLFPRLFSVLDHYRYFSQLLIAFRLMAVDLVAVFVLILIACSGFFVAFTMSFGKRQYDANEVAYRIFQILMGFTPAAWEAWETYNALGKALLALFLTICHFLVVTILITVLTNSFMAIVSNANDEHQFVFAVNTISMVKNDALFSYVAPSNIFAWLLTPLRFCLPFRVFIKTNRTVIKATHFPLLFGIFAYEKLFLAREVFEPTDLVENHGARRPTLSFQEVGGRLFSPNLRLRQESIAGFQKDKALDEVFRLTPRGDTLRNMRKNTDQTHNVVNNWMDHQGDAPSPPQEQDRSVVDRLEQRRQARKATMLRQRGISREFSGTRSVASDPAEFMSTGAFHHGADDQPNIDQTDADGDDELVTNDDDEGQTPDKRSGTRSRIFTADKENNSGSEDYFHTPNLKQPGSARLSSTLVSSHRRFPGNTLAIPKASPPRRRPHNRNMSSNTILYKPVTSASLSSSKHISGTATPSGSAQKTGHRTPRHSIYTTARTKARPILPGRANLQSVPNFNTVLDNPTSTRQVRHRRSSLDMGISELGLENTHAGLVPSSFATQMALATGGWKGFGKEKGRDETEGMMGRLMLARMKTLEEGFQEVVREFRSANPGISRASTARNSAAGNSSVEGGEMRRKTAGHPNLRKKKGVGLVRTRSEIDVGTLGRGRGPNNMGAHEQMAGFANSTASGAEQKNTPERQNIERYVTRGSSL